ncbi:hypothetical protein QOT17_001642 [Balamuthia mandrillaris]
MGRNRGLSVQHWFIVPKVTVSTPVILTLSSAPKEDLRSDDPTNIGATASSTGNLPGSTTGRWSGLARHTTHTILLLTVSLLRLFSISSTIIQLVENYSQHISSFLFKLHLVSILRFLYIQLFFVLKVLEPEHRTKTGTKRKTGAKRI